jgi:hypothetical protein
MSIGASFLGGLGGGAIGSAAVNLYLNSAQYNEQLAAAEAKTKASTGQMTSTTSKFGSLATTAYVAVAAAAAKFAVDSIAAASEHEQVLAALTAQVGENTQAFQDQATALQNLTGYEDETILAADTILARFKLTDTQIRQSIPTILDYARATGKSVPDSANLIGKALLGNARALKTVGINFTATGNTAEDFNTIMDALNKKVGGQAAAYAETYAGKLDILKAKFNDLQEAVGGPLIDELVKFADTLNTLFAIGQKLTDSMPGWVGQFISLANNLNPVKSQLGLVEGIITKVGDALHVTGGEVETSHLQMIQLADAASTVADAVSHFADIEDGAAAATRRHTAAMQEQRLAELELAGGLIGLIANQSAVADDQATLNKLRGEGKTKTAEYRQALQDLVIDQLAVNEGVRDQAAKMRDAHQTTGDLKGVIREMGHQAGLTGDEIKTGIIDPLSTAIEHIQTLNRTPLQLRIGGGVVSGINSVTQALIDAQRALGGL